MEVIVHTVRGKSSFARVLHDQLMINYAKDGKEWKLDVEITEDTVKELKKLRCGHKVRRAEEKEMPDGTIKPPYLGGRPYLSFKRAELSQKGEKNQPITIVDVMGNPWDQSKEIGNESVIDVKFAIADTPQGKKATYIRGIRVLDLVPYERKAFADLDENDPYYVAAKAAKDNENAHRELDDSLEDVI